TNVAPKDFAKGFQAYHPFTTYSAGNTDRVFLDHEGQRAPKGWSIANEANPDTSALFRLGKSAFELLPQVATIQEFDLGLRHYHDGVDELRPVITEMLSSGRILAVGEGGV